MKTGLLTTWSLLPSRSATAAMLPRPPFPARTVQGPHDYRIPGAFHGVSQTSQEHAGWSPIQVAPMKQACTSRHAREGNSVQDVVVADPLIHLLNVGMPSDAVRWSSRCASDRLRCRNVRVISMHSISTIQPRLPRCRRVWRSSSVSSSRVIILGSTWSIGQRIQESRSTTTTPQPAIDHPAPTIESGTLSAAHTHYLHFNALDRLGGIKAPLWSPSVSKTCSLPLLRRAGILLADEGVTT